MKRQDRNLEIDLVEKWNLFAGSDAESDRA